MLYIHVAVVKLTSRSSEMREDVAVEEPAKFPAKIRFEFCVSAAPGRVRPQRAACWGRAGVLGPGGAGKAGPGAPIGPRLRGRRDVRQRPRRHARQQHSWEGRWSEERNVHCPADREHTGGGRPQPAPPHTPPTPRQIQSLLVTPAATRHIQHSAANWT